MIRVTTQYMEALNVKSQKKSNSVTDRLIISK